MKTIFSVLLTIFGALIDFVVGLLCIVVMAAAAICLFPITVVFAVLGLFYFVGTRLGWIKNLETEELDVVVTTPSQESSQESSQEVFYDVE